MKTKIYYFGVLLFVFSLNFAWSINSDGLNDDYSQLKENIKSTFVDLIENVELINFAEKNGYYFYEIIGTKGKNKVTFSIKVSEENFKTKTFNSSFKSDNQEQVIYCYWVLGQCVLPKDDVLNICGRYINGQCEPL